MSYNTALTRVDIAGRILAGHNSETRKFLVWAIMTGSRELLESADLTAYLVFRGISRRAIDTTLTKCERDLSAISRARIPLNNRY